MNRDETPFRSLTRDGRRERIAWAAWAAFVEKGLDEASMDDVAARAGTTKPTVYAHFKSKDELFAAVLDMIKGVFLGRLRSPDTYAPEPLEAIALFCGRYLELASTRDAVGYQRFILGATSRNPAVGQTVYDSLLAEVLRSLESYLHERELTDRPEQDAELLMWATAVGPVLRCLYGVDEPSETLPDGEVVGAHIDMERIRETVARIVPKPKP